MDPRDDVRDYGRRLSRVLLATMIAAVIAIGALIVVESVYRGGYGTSAQKDFFALSTLGFVWFITFTPLLAWFTAIDRRRGRPQPLPPARVIRVPRGGRVS